MSFSDLQSYIDFLDTKSMLKRIKTEVNPCLEITEIAHRMIKSKGQALLFENVKGSSYPVVINLFGTLERTCLAFGVKSPDELSQRVSSLASGFPFSSLLDKAKMLKKLVGFGKFQPKVVRSAICQEVVEKHANLLELPVLKCWPEDAGRFITLPLVITKNPLTGIQNTGMYRIQILDEQRGLMHWHLHHDGARHHRIYAEKNMEMDIAIAIGCDPITIYSATAPLPPGIDEMILSGFLSNSPVEMVKAKTVDLFVPANAEFIIEAKVSVSETQTEGPFGDHTGFYSEADNYPVFKVEAVTRRKNPVYPATIVGVPPMEDYYLGKMTERIFLPLLKLQLPEIADINFPCEGVFHNCLFVSIKKTYPGQARKVASSLWGMGQMMLTKTIIIVDEDVNVQNCSETAWKVFSNVDPERDIFFTKGPLDVLDHASSIAVYGSKAGIDATKKLPEEGHNRHWPKEIKMNTEIKKLVDSRWKEYGF